MYIGQIINEIYQNNLTLQTLIDCADLSENQIRICKDQKAVNILLINELQKELTPQPQQA